MVSRLCLLEEEDEKQQEAPLITINESYAKRFTHNKKREALHRLQELEKQGLVDDSDDDSDEDDDEDGFLPSRTQLQIFETLSKIKKKDPSIYSDDVKFFDEDDEDAGDPPAKEQEKQKKPVYLKDALAKQLIEDGPDLQEEAPKRRATKTYAQEQEELKNAFLSGIGEESSDEEGDGGGLLKLRKKTAEELEKDLQEDEEAVAEADQRSKDAEIVRRMEEYFGKDDELDENEKFLKDFLLNQGWMDQDENRIPSYDEIVGNLSDDEEELKRQERFEADYNFRFEEGASSQVLGHSRVVEGSVRKKDDARKKQRQNKKSRFSEEELERREELKRLKNIKKKEILEKLGKIRTIAGASVDDPNALSALGEDDLEEEFDPEEYDRKMKEAFGDEYYGAEDADVNFQGYDEEDLQKPDFDAEDDLLALPKISDKPGKHGFAAAREETKAIENSSFGREGVGIEDRQNSDMEGELGNPEDDFGDNMAEDESLQLKSTFKRKNKGKISFREKLAFDKQLEEYYKLDYEDRIGDLPTRFKYRQVKPNMYGLKTWEVLMADDKDLNQHVSLKKIAPYVTEEWVPKRKFRSSQKMRKKEALLQLSKKTQKSETEVSGSVDNRSSKDGLLVSLSIPNGTQQSNAEIEGSKKRKRKHRRGGLAIPQSRLIAYGKICVPSKRKKKA